MLRSAYIQFSSSLADHGRITAARLRQPLIERRIAYVMLAVQFGETGGMQCASVQALLFYEDTMDGILFISGEQ